MYQNLLEPHDFLAVASLLRQKPHGVARFTGGEVQGILRLYPMPRGVLLAVEAAGLPQGTFFDLAVEGGLPLPPLLSYRGHTIQVMVAGCCTVEDLIGLKVTLRTADTGQTLAEGTITP